MKTVYLFDVDGTLTPPRQPMRKGFAEFFRKFVVSHNVILVSGSDYAKLCEQVPRDILEGCAGVFGCSGAEFLENGNLVFRKMHTFPEAMLDMINAYVDQSTYPLRLGTHVEFRPGMLNISVVGRKADQGQRKAYHEWDRTHAERSRFAAKLMEHFPEYEATCGGEISIDIVPKGWSKASVKPEVLERFPQHRLVFFGDRMGQQGNDRPLADALNMPSGRHLAVEVSGYKDTWIHLRHMGEQAPDQDEAAPPVFAKVATRH